MHHYPGRSFFELRSGFIAIKPSRREEPQVDITKVLDEDWLLHVLCGKFLLMPLLGGTGGPFSNHLRTAGQ